MKGEKFYFFFFLPSPLSALLHDFNCVCWKHLRSPFGVPHDSSKVEFNPRKLSEDTMLRKFAIAAPSNPRLRCASSQSLLELRAPRWTNLSLDILSWGKGQAVGWVHGAWLVEMDNQVHNGQGAQGMSLYDLESIAT